ncbi:MAG: response regulator, partial [gamma proteobacterium symbiont of Taylorina sp.]|nr:response regulator [gamma proteobacterium symbiont of Taylorina sp.]
MVSGDERKLRQILINLMGNSVKFTPFHGEIKLKLISGDTDRIQFNIEDTGQGIPASDLEKIFKPFQQSNSIASEEGTGLGLAISSSFIHLLGGELQVESEVDKGSRFFFDIPLPGMTSLSQNKEIGQKVIAIDQRESSSQPNPHILVAIENNVGRELLRDLLEKIGFETSLAVNGQQALEIFKRQGQDEPLDLVICDVKMPEMSGEILLKEIKSSQLQLPVILTSSYVLSSEENRLLALGADAFIPKPIDAEKLFQSIAQQLDVRYRYKTLINNVQDAAHNVSSLHQLFEQLPQAQRQQLQQLMDEGDLKRIRQQAEVLKKQQQNKNLGEYIHEMAGKYDMDALQKLFNH